MENMNGRKMDAQARRRCSCTLKTQRVSPPGDASPLPRSLEKLSAAAGCVSTPSRLKFSREISIFFPTFTHAQSAESPNRPSLLVPQGALARSFAASGLSPAVIASPVAAAGKIPDHHHGARHSICCAEGVGGCVVVVVMVGAVNIVNGNCGLSVSVPVTWCGEDTFPSG